MARKKSNNESVRSGPTIQQIEFGISRLKKRVQELQEFDVDSIKARYDSVTRPLEVSISETLAAIFGHNTPRYNKYRSATKLDHGPMMEIGEPPRTAREARAYVSEGIHSSIQLLNQAICGLEEEVEGLRYAFSGSDKQSVPSPPVRDTPTSVFIVHGHDESSRESVARFLENCGLKVIILHEQPNRGRTVIEKVEAQSDVGFAVVLLTPDDVGSKTGERLRPRPRQNVLLELGYFIGCLGRSRVCALSTDSSIELPTDFAGVVWKLFDPHGAWKMELARELRESGFEIDLNKI